MSALPPKADIRQGNRELNFRSSKLVLFDCRRQNLTKWTQVGRPAIAPLAGHVRFLSKADMPTYFIEAHSLKPGGRDQ